MHKKRFTIGLIVPALNNIYTKLITQGVHSELSTLDANLLILPGESINSPRFLIDQNESSVYNLTTSKNMDAVILPASTFSNFMSDFEFQQWVDKFSTVPIVSIGMDISKFTDNQSSILIHNNSGLETLMMHLINDHKYTEIAYLSGQKDNVDGIERLATFKACLKKGNLPFKESYFYQGAFSYLDGVDCVTEFFDNRNIRPQVIVCANDSCALGVIDELTRRGIKIPQEIAVTGFDNSKESEFSIPPISTVSQPLFELGVKAAQTAIRFAENKTVDKQYYLDTIYVNRESCGCSRNQSTTVANDKIIESNTAKSNVKDIQQLIIKKNLTESGVVEIFSTIISILNDTHEIKDKNDSLENILDKLYYTFQQNIKNKKSLDVWTKHIKLFELQIINTKNLNSNPENTSFLYHLKYLHQKSLNSGLESSTGFNDKAFTLRNFLRKIFFSTTFESLSELLKTELENLDVSNFYLSYYDSPSNLEKSVNWTPPEFCNILNAYDTDKFNYKFKDLEKYPADEIFPKKYFPEDKRFTFVIESLFLSGSQLGWLCYDWSVKDSDMLSNLMLNSQISAAIKNIHMHNEQRIIKQKVNSLMKSLTNSNIKLETQSYTDELTKLLNRRGFYNKTKIILENSKLSNYSCELIVFDLDGLKIINDQFGHNSGDIAISEFANILTHSFRDNDAIARFGGDEFIVMVDNISKMNINKKLDEIKMKTVEFTNRNEEDWVLCSSMGNVTIDHSSAINLDKIIEQADRVLYECKNKRRGA